MNARGERKSGWRGADPTKMVNQPALQTSSGVIWLVVGAIFAALSLIPLGFLIFAGGESKVVAIAIALAIIVCYGLIVVARVVHPQGPQRLKLMAAAMLTMAGIALIGIWVCAVIEGAAAN